MPWMCPSKGMRGLALQAAVVLIFLVLMIRTFPPQSGAERLEDWIEKQEIVETSFRSGTQWPTNELYGTWISVGAEYSLRIYGDGSQIACEWTVFPQSSHPVTLVRHATYEQNGLLRLKRAVCNLEQQVVFRDFITIEVNGMGSHNDRVMVPAPTARLFDGVPQDVSRYFVLYKSGGR